MSDIFGVDDVQKHTLIVDQDYASHTVKVKSLDDSQPTQSDALREALERIGVGMMPPEIIEGKLMLRLMRVDIAQEQSK